jgi:hypothetical protein
MAGAVPTLILLLLAGVAASQSIERVSRTIGFDFYQFWGVPVARRLAGPTLGSPYRDGARYAETLTTYAAASSDARLKTANDFWKRPDFAGSPLLYPLFAPVSSDYGRAVSTYQALQLICFVAALVLLGRLHRWAPFFSLCLGLLCLLFYNPLLSELHTGNLGCVQLIGLTALLFLDAAIGHTVSASRRAALGAVFLAALVLLALAKPNVTAIALLLAVHLGARYGARLWAAAAAPAALVGALLVALPCVYFGSWGIWREWYEAVLGADRYMLVRPVEIGNFSTSLIVSRWLGLDVYLVSALLLAVVAVSPIVATAWSGATARPSAIGAARAAAGRLLANPHAAMGTAIVLTIGVSPLVWLHYYVLVLIPSLWLLAGPGRSARPWCGAAAVVMSSGVLAFVLRPLPSPLVMPASVALSWLPLWAGMLLYALDGGAGAVTEGAARSLRGVPPAHPAPAGPSASAG